MASVRLNEEIRGGIRRAMLEHRFGDELTQLYSDRAALARAVYYDLYKPKERRLIESLPKGWLRTGSSLNAKFGASYQTLFFNGMLSRSQHYQTLPRKTDVIELPMANKHMGACVKVYEAGHRMTERFHEIEARSDAMQKRLSEASRAIQTALGKAQTTKRLAEIWPETAPFCKPYEKNAPQLPGVPTEKLNEMLDLPVEETKIAA